MSDGTFNFDTILKKKYETNHCPSTFQHKVKTLGTGIWFIIVRMGPNRKYLLRLHTYPTFTPAYTLKKNRQIVWNQI